jgi:glycosyltransferase involved in cell wall biosynthesis
MKTAIYTISKNEEHNVLKFMQAAEGAKVYVLDTGSTDNTVDLLKSKGAFVEQKEINPWRFDAARNSALNMIPSDIDVCVSLDMDEQIESGWQAKLKNEWKGNIGNYRYIAEWKDIEKTIPSIISPRTRIHNRHGFVWHRKIHEVIKPIDESSAVMCDTSILVKHYQDGKQRNYCNALDELIQDNPKDFDARLQRAGELLQKKEYKKALEDYFFYVQNLLIDNHEVIRHRKSLAWISIAYCLHNLGDNNSASRAFLFAVAEDPSCREAWCHLAHITNQLGNLPLAYGAAETAKNIKEPKYFQTIDHFFWGDYPENLSKEIFSKLKEI